MGRIVTFSKKIFKKIKPWKPVCVFLSSVVIISGLILFGIIGSHDIEGVERNIKVCLNELSPIIRCVSCEFRVVIKLIKRK